MPDFETTPISSYANDPTNVIANAVFTPLKPEGAAQTTIKDEFLRLDAREQAAKDVPDDADIIGLFDSLTARGLKAFTWAKLKAALTAQLANVFVPTGSIHQFVTFSIPSGYLKANGLTIGNQSSGATARANADTAALFKVLWEATTNDVLPIQTATGAASTRGASAAADFAAGKRLPLPDLRGEFVRGADDGRGVDTGRAVLSSQVGTIQSHAHTGTADSGGAHTHTGSTDVQGSHSHSGITDVQGSHTHTFGGSGADNGDQGPYATTAPSQYNGEHAVSTAGSHNHNLSINAAGAHAHNVAIASGGAHSHNLTIAATGGTETRPRSVALVFAIKL